MGNKSFGKGYNEGYTEGRKNSKKDNNVTTIISFLAGIAVGAIGILFGKTKQ